MLVDGRGVPLSLVVTGAHRHDVSQLEAVLDAMQVKRPLPPKRRSKHLCADAGYRGAPAMKTLLAHGYIPHVKGRRQEADELKRHPDKRARRWVVEVAHSCCATGNCPLGRQRSRNLYCKFLPIRYVEAILHRSRAGGRCLLC